MSEIWKPVKGYEGYYEVSSEGRIKSIKRTTTKGGIMKPRYDNYGYLKIMLCKNNETKSLFVHRIVAEAFIEGKSEINKVVNHKNEIKDDNRVENLEWCSIAYNTNYNGAAYRRVAGQRKKVKATKEGKSIVFDSVAEASRVLGVSHGNISECAHNKYGRRSLKGYVFSFEV